MVTGWRDRTPQGFVFAAKVPKLITSIKILRDCEQELSRFLKVMEPLGEKLGPLLLQFPYFNKTVFASREQIRSVASPVSKFFAQRISLCGRNSQQELDQLGLFGAPERSFGRLRVAGASPDARHR